MLDILTNAALIMLLFAIIVSAAATVAVPVYAIPYSWYQLYQQQQHYQQYPQFNYNQFNYNQFKTQLWQRLCDNSYIASTASTVPNCSGVGVGVGAYQPQQQPIIPPQLSQQQSNAVASSQTSQCINGECFVTTCNNFVCSSTGTPPSQTTGQFSSTITSTCINGVCKICVNGQCQVSNSTTQTQTQLQLQR